jgi:hypothetical protein
MIAEPTFAAVPTADIPTIVGRILDQMCYRQKEVDGAGVAKVLFETGKCRDLFTATVNLLVVGWYARFEYRREWQAFTLPAWRRQGVMRAMHEMVVAVGA